MGLLDTLRHAVRGYDIGRGRAAARRLHLKVERLFEEGRFREATEAARELLGVMRQEHGEDHPDFATSMSNLALLLQCQGDLEGAEPLLRQALAIRRTLFGECHPDFATTLNNLGELLSLRGDQEGAETLLRQALAVREQLLGRCHPDYAISLSSLALLLKKRGDAAGAESLLRQALEVRREMLGEFDPDYATGLSNLALLLFERGDLAQAEALLRQALDVRRAALGEHHPDYIATSKSLARLLQRRAGGPRIGESSTRMPSPGRPTAGAPAQEEDGLPGAQSGPWPGLEPTLTDIASSPIGRDEEGAPRLERGGDEIAEEAAQLAEMFQEAGDRLGEAGERMGAEGVFPDASVFRSLAVCHYRLSMLRAEVRSLAESRGVPSPPPEAVAGLRGIGSLLEAVARAEAEGSRAQALDVLERVLRLRARDDGEVVPTGLHECQAGARELHRIISASPALEPPPVVGQLAAGEHPFASLLTLVERFESLNDDQRSALQQTVSWAYGRRLAEFAGGARLFLSPESEPRQPAGPEPLEPRDEVSTDRGDRDG
jgi:tetratricopeptide (TPR) repeat protein